MMEFPLVSIICLCYNHEKFLEEALLSVLQQDYPNTEIIVIDDYSNDGSAEKIKKIAAQYPQIRFLPNERNIGNCASFNRGFELSKGAFIVDFATDDVMMPGKITRQVAQFHALPESYGVAYSDAEVISEEGTFLGYHHKGTKKEFFHPEGDIFRFVLQQYFICPPTMMMRRAVLEQSGGYDASLAYEDFNFWVVSSRDFKYAFLPEALIKRRVVKKSFSLAFYTRNNTPLFQTTFDVVKKAFYLCKNEEERKILAQRIKFEMRHATFMEEFSVAKQYKPLLIELKSYSWNAKLYHFISSYSIRFFWLYRILLEFKGVYKVR